MAIPQLKRAPRAKIRAYRVDVAEATSETALLIPRRGCVSLYELGGDRVVEQKLLRLELGDRAVVSGPMSAGWDAVAAVVVTAIEQQGLAARCKRLAGELLRCVGEGWAQKVRRAV